MQKSHHDNEKKQKWSGEMAVKDKKTKVESLKRSLSERYGIDADAFAENDLEIYITQMDILKGLEKQMQEDGYVVTKEYVKGRLNVCSHPSIKDYNNTADSSHKTVNAIRKFIKEYGDASTDNSDDELMKILSEVEDD